MKIFLVSGKSGSGKGEVAKLIKEYYDERLEKSVITEYSKYLKMFAKELTDWDGSSETKPRSFLQNLGDLARKIDNKYLIDNMIKDISIYQEFVSNIIIADVRMIDEIEDMKLKFDNVYSIYVKNEFGESKLNIEEKNHFTETNLDNYHNYDYVLINDDFDSLKEKVFKFLGGI